MKKRNSDLVQFFLTVGILCAVALLSSVVFFKLDITAEKRIDFQTSLEMLESLEGRVYVRVYLHGEFPADYWQFGTRPWKSVWLNSTVSATRTHRIRIH